MPELQKLQRAQQLFPLQVAQPLKLMRSALIPTINQMAAAGIVTMPGIMTGQLLAGMNPLAASRYQILLMFLITGGNVIAAVLSTSLLVRRLCDDRERLRLDRLRGSR